MGVVFDYTPPPHELCPVVLHCSSLTAFLRVVRLGLRVGTWDRFLFSPTSPLQHLCFPPSLISLSLSLFSSSPLVTPGQLRPRCTLPHAHSFPLSAPRRRIRRRAMAGVKSLVLLLLLALAVATSASASSIAGGDHMQLGGLLAGAGRGKECRGTVGECGADADGDDDAEGELGSASAEAHRRFLQGRNSGYISYGALRRGTVPCSRRGASYYNCRPGAQANPYRRGCSRITRCRG